VADVLGALRTTKPGDQVVLTIVRHGDRPQLKVTVGAQG
jgi:S1-C subfamily serine protease